MPRRISETRRVVWLLPEPVRTAHTETTGLMDLIWVAFGAHQAEISPGCQNLGGFVHDQFVRHIAVGENDLVDFVFMDQLTRSLSA